MKQQQKETTVVSSFPWNVNKEVTGEMLIRSHLKNTGEVSAILSKTQETRNSSTVASNTANLRQLALSTLWSGKVFVNKWASGAFLAGNERQGLFWAGNERVGFLR